MNKSEVKAKVDYFESLVQQLESMSSEERSKLKKEMVEFYDSLEPNRKPPIYGQPVPLPLVVSLGIGLIKLFIGALRNSEEEMDIRERMAKLIALV